MPRKRRTPTEIEEVRVAIEHLMAEHGPMTVRQVHYALVSRPELDFENTSFEYQNLERYLIQLQRDGQIGYDAVVDGPRFRQTLGWNEAHDYLNAENYRRNLRSTQPEHLQVWVESRPLAGIIETFCLENRLELWEVSNASRLSVPWSVNEALRNAASLGLDSKPWILLYVGDFVLTRRNSPNSVAKEFAARGISDVEVKRIAVTSKQVDSFLPANPTTQTTVEAEALPKPDLLRLLREAIDSHTDEDLLRKERSQEESEKRYLCRQCGHHNAPPPIHHRGEMLRPW